MKCIFIVIVTVVLMNTITLVISKSCTKVGDCKCKTENGDEIDLGKYGDDTGITPKFKNIIFGTFTYSYNPCTSFSDGSCYQVIGCQSQAYTIALESTESFSVIDNEYAVSYDDGTADRSRRTEVLLKCDDRVSGDASFKVLSDNLISGYTLYKFEMSHADFCGSAGGESSGGLSIGSILCIVLLVLVIVYFVGGILFLKYARGKTGSELILGKDDIVKFPGLVKDGSLFVFGKCTKRGEYSNVETG